MRRGFRGSFGNVAITGFESAFDIRDVPPTETTLVGSHAFGNDKANVAYVEDGTNEEELADDDAGLDERAWFGGGDGNSEQAFDVPGCFSDLADGRPSAAAPTGVAPPSDGFFDASPYVGAFSGPEDSWATGSWATVDPS